MKKNILKKWSIISLIGISFSTMAYNEELEEDFSNNSVSVVSVSENFVKELKSEGDKNKEAMETFLQKNCQEELLIFCKNTDRTNYNCLRDNFNLTTGKCRKILEHEFGKGIVDQRLSIHDLKLTANTKLLERQDAIGFTVGTYLSKEMFDYRGLRFRKGFLKARNYKYSDFNGQYVIFSGKPLNVFKDASGIIYNPKLQKGPLFFDEKGNVKIGTLWQDYTYKDLITLKKGTIIVFNDQHEFIRGTLAKSVRIGKCGFLTGMEITERELKNCLEKK